MYGKGKKTTSKGKGGGGGGLVDADGYEMDINKLIKDIQFFGSSSMTWKERKELENRRVVSLGGKPPKKHRMPLSIARVTMKKRKEREEKMLQEQLVLGCFGGKLGNGANRVTEKHKSDNRVLKTSEGHFSRGVLDVKHLLRQGSSSRGSDSKPQGFGFAFGDNGKKKGSVKKKGKKGKRKGGKKRG